MPMPALLKGLLSLVLAALFAISALPAPARQPATGGNVDADVTALIAALRDSGCRFKRNGSWYDADKAARHLQRKYDYIKNKGQLKSAEQFIELAGTGSSVSGKPYQVQCAGVPVQDSARWLRERLQHQSKAS